MVSVLREHCVAFQVRGLHCFAVSMHNVFSIVMLCEIEAEIMKMSFQIRDKTDTDSKESNHTGRRDCDGSFFTE